MNHYLPDETYRRLVELLAGVEPETVGDRLAIDPEKIKLALCEGGVWPETVRKTDRSRDRKMLQILSQCH